MPVEDRRYRQVVDEREFEGVSAADDVIRRLGGSVQQPGQDVGFDGIVGAGIDSGVQGEPWRRLGPQRRNDTWGQRGSAQAGQQPAPVEPKDLVWKGLDTGHFLPIIINR